MEFRDLKANEIDLRVGTVTARGYTLLLYKDARCDMNILDETVGSENWQRDHKEVKGNLYCGVSIWSESKKQWVTKWDCGAETFTEKEKGEASDSFKRACFNWGIGRELYTAPFIWFNEKTEEVNGKFKLSFAQQKEINNLVVSKIEYQNKAISFLEISTKKGDVVYSWRNGKEEKIESNEENFNKVEKPAIIGGDYVLTGGKYDGKTIDQVLAEDEQYIRYCITHSKNQFIIANMEKALQDNGLAPAEDEL